ncbi:hypothetical protein BDR04DRAFT_1098752 [Suillus decipiens]|nr:hypothetical protein BDR04DRAFT_1098752 [Suillus decipiens]
MAYSDECISHWRIKYDGQSNSFEDLYQIYPIYLCIPQALVARYIGLSLSTDKRSRRLSSDNMRGTCGSSKRAESAEHHR